MSKSQKPTNISNNLKRIQLSGIRRHSFLEHRKPDHEQLYGLMGESLIFQTNEKRLLDAADEAFGRFPLPSSSKDPLVIQLFVTGKSREPILLPLKPDYTSQGHLFSINAGNQGYALADLRSGFAIGYLSTEMLQDLTYVRYNFIEPLGLSMLGLSRKYFVVHAACVVKHGISFLLHARAGTGKSTLAYACVRRGYQLLAEDAVQVKALPSGVQLWGAPWRFHLLPDARQLFPEIGGRQEMVQVNGEWKIEIDLEEMYPGSTIIQAAPGPVVLLERKRSVTSGIQPVDRKQAMSQFEVIWSWQTGWDEYLESASQCLLDHGIYRLSMNASPDDAVDALDTLLAELL